MINLFKLLGFQKKPESKFNHGDLVIYNLAEKPGDEADELYSVEFKRFGTCSGNPVKKWYYDGTKFKMEKTGSKGLPFIPTYSTGCFNTPEEYLHSLDEIRSSKNNQANLSEQK